MIANQYFLVPPYYFLDVRTARDLGTEVIEGVLTCPNTHRK